MQQMQLQGIKCLLCRGQGDHAVGCKIRQIEKLQDRNFYLDCPMCTKERQIGLNKMDFFECRSCHAQFSTSPFWGGKNSKLITLMGVNCDQIFTARSLKERGDGFFPIDIEIERLKKDIAKEIIKLK